MTPFRLVALLVCIASVACGKADAPPAAGAAATGTTTTPDTSHAAPSEVKIEEGMLRDLRLTTAKVESRRGGEDITLLGELAVNQGTYAEVGTPVQARVTRVLVGPGDTVIEAQPILELQSGEVGRTRSEYLSAMGRVALAESALLRKRELAAERIVPQREVQEAEAEATSARAALRAVAAALSALGLGVPVETAGQDATSSVFVLRAPLGGTVIERQAMRGQMLDPGTPALRVADLSTLWLTVHAFERDAVRILKGASARVAFSALPGQQFPGDVTLVGNQVDRESRTVDVRIDVKNRGGLLRPGMSASAALPIGAANAPILTIPVAAVQRVGESWCVFIPKDKGTFEIRKIGRGRDLGTEVEVLSGLVAGDTIVVDGAFLLKSQAEKRDAGHGGH